MISQLLTTDLKVNTRVCISQKFNKCRKSACEVIVLHLIWLFIKYLFLHVSVSLYSVYGAVGYLAEQKD